MKKEQLIAQLEGAKTLTSVVSIDNVIALIQQLEPEVEVKTVFGIHQEMADQIAGKIERCLDYNSSDFVDTDSAEFELDYNNTIRLDRVDVDTNAIMEHITATLDSFILDEMNAKEAEEDEDEDDDAPDSSWTIVDGGSPSAHIAAE